MIETIELSPGMTLRHCRDTRFKQGALSLQFLRPMCREEAAMNALLPAVLLRGCKEYPDLRAITLHLDDLYGASVSALVRRVGDIQTTGLYCGFMEDRFAMDGDAIFAPMVAFLRQLLLEPVLENGVFSHEFVESEKKNLISTIQSEINDKRVYANAKLLRLMCRKDSFGLPRLGTVEDVAAIDASKLYAHYMKVCRESRMEFFYVGSMGKEAVAAMLRSQFSAPVSPSTLPTQTAFHPCDGVNEIEVMDISQAKLCLGYVTPITNQSPEFAAMQVFNTIFGGGMTSKLFMNVREKLSLCYSIGSGYYGTKGLLTVSAGIDAVQEDRVRQEISAQLDDCRNCKVTAQELESAKAALLSSLRSVHDSPGAIEGYYCTSVLSGLKLTPAAHIEAISKVSIADIAAVADTVQLHSSFLLKGETA